ncbi:hypothetical protein K469DRAFT_645505 [Zopfia rhizophila CBS 207.26]|uniref:Uncharacterized protein n=1 Tax=Zopfia rhizophila CBS 207.26 TaxID=1314779 RepID=A0A6A6DB26_9PEZI|nr:hypothetical protein K469DRAFT_645505 [Zopfia rhizophila CBS 207.26]
MATVQALATTLAYTAGTWKTNTVDLLQNPVLPEVCYIFLEDGDFYKKKCTESGRRKILGPFDAPDFLSNQLCTDLNGYFGSKSSFNAKELVGVSTWFRCLVKRVLKPREGKARDGKNYLWYEMGFFTRWSHPNGCRVLCIGTPEELRMQLEVVLRKSPSLELRDPFVMLRPLLDQIIKLYDDSTWRMRDEVRAIEENRLKQMPDFVAMHEISRHTGHVVEVEAVAIETIENLFHRQKTTYESLSTPLDKTYQEQAREYLSFQLQMMKSLKWRSLSNQERLNAEITLAYNMIASQDNTVIKSIAVLTMTFLPATFISALFSTTFFSYGEGKWKFSSQFWIYWVVVVLTTLLVLLIWWRWLGGSFRNAKSPSWKQCGKQKKSIV